MKMRFLSFLLLALALIHYGGTEYVQGHVSYEQNSAMILTPKHRVLLSAFGHGKHAKISVHSQDKSNCSIHIMFYLFRTLERALLHRVLITRATLGA
jgi:hypothetical protein